ncbi:hypothetical protein [Exiguobacterium sp. RIT594]|uniref:hypothetical protein n=1 Tax=Exiguobacterium sp. RIT594 TaxID=2282449 RepID=UPI0011C06621|nr:hypothetical protein [Exiguobacterium sp. RIT594]
MAAIALYISMRAADISEAAQKDSSRSADATERSTEIAQQAREDSKLSAEIARDALQLALQDSMYARERFRSERGPILNLQKSQMCIPLIIPFIPSNSIDPDDHTSKWDYSTIILSNEGVGIATTVDLSWDFSNAEEYDRFSFYTSEIIKPSYTLQELSRVKDIFPAYGLEVKFVELDGIRSLAFQGTPGDVAREEKLMFKRTRHAQSDGLSRVGALKNGEQITFDLPWTYLALAQQFFLERLMVMSEEKQLIEGSDSDVEKWKTPTPRLRIRIEYVDAILEHLNDFNGSSRVKEFEITCSDNVDLVYVGKEDRPDHYSELAMRCHFNIQTIFDRPLSTLSTGEETIDGSTKPTKR